LNPRTREGLLFSRSTQRRPALFGGIRPPWSESSHMTSELRRTGLNETANETVVELDPNMSPTEVSKTHGDQGLAVNEVVERAPQTMVRHPAKGAEAAVRGGSSQPDRQIEYVSRLEHRLDEVGSITRRQVRCPPTFTRVRRAWRNELKGLQHNSCCPAPTPVNGCRHRTSRYQDRSSRGERASTTRGCPSETTSRSPRGGATT
jgi:hypothetical protein